MTVPPSMVERVARAICLSQGRDPDETVLMGSQHYPQWDYYRPDAQAAIAAMREPTEAMYDGATGDKMWAERNSREVYQAYIDAALRE